MQLDINTTLIRIHGCTRKETGLEETVLVGGRSTVSRLGNVVFRQRAPWSETTIRLLRHLEQANFRHAPRVIESGFDAHGRETLEYVEGESIHPAPWDDNSLPVIGEMLRELHDATRTFDHRAGDTWRPWFGRQMGAPSVIGHCDTGPWNIICTARRPTALIDWEEAGPVNPMVELAQACWLNAQLFDDDIAERQGLPSLENRGKQAKLLLDGYGLPRSRRESFIDLVKDFAILSSANEAQNAGITPETSDTSSLWGIAWRARSAAWIVRNRQTLQNAIMSAC